MRASLHFNQWREPFERRGARVSHDVRVWLVVVLLGVFAAGLARPAQAQSVSVSGFEHTSFNLSFDASSVNQVGNDDPDLVFRDVTFGVAMPVASRLGVWLSVSKSADFNRNAAEGARRLTGSFGGGLSYIIAKRGPVTLQAQGGVMSRLERVGDGGLNPTALRIGAKVGYRVLGKPGEDRWFGFFLQGGSDLAMRDIMSADDGDIMKGDTTYYARVGFEFSL